MVSRRGFTLIELLVVMAIVALLLSIALPRYFGSLDRSREVALKENLQVLRVTLDRFHADKGRYPDTLDELVEHKYLLVARQAGARAGAAEFSPLDLRAVGRLGLEGVGSA